MSDNPFLLSHFVDLTEFPQVLAASSETTCVDPFVALVHFFDSLPDSDASFERFPQIALKNQERIFLGPDVEIDPFVMIEGPVWIGRGVKIKHGAYVRPYTLIDDHAVVGHACEIKHSILCKGAKAAHFNYVGDTILGPRVNLGAGVMCANVKLNKAKIKLRAQEKSWALERRKLGAIIGTEALIGCNAVLSPGTLITPYTKIPPCTHVSGYH